MKKLIALLIFFGYSMYSFAQTCNCLEGFNFAVNKIEKNYPGLKDKITQSNKTYYRIYTDSIRSLAATPENQQQAACVKVIDTWLKFFNDRHLGVYIPNNNAGSIVTLNKDSIRAKFANSPQAVFTPVSFSEYLLRNKKKLKPLEGSWRYELGAYTIGIYYDKGKYTGFILKADSIYWMPGQIKMEIIPSRDSTQLRLFLRDHSLRLGKINLIGINNGYFEDQQQAKWLKLDDQGNLIFKGYYPYSAYVNFKKLDSQTNLLTIKSFSDFFRKLIDSVVNANDNVIKSTDNLIIDIRGNGGGSDVSYSPLEKYFFTNPYTSITAEIYCTNDNIQKFRELATNPNYATQEQEKFRERVNGMEQHLNQYWSSSPVYDNSDTLPVLSKPKKIAVIIDSLCGSTTEQFLLDIVLNSKKATIYGVHSAGVLDYSNNYSFTIPNTNILVQYPTSRSRRIDLGKGIDNKGIQPQVEIDRNVTDWIKYVQNDLE